MPFISICSDVFFSSNCYIYYGYINFSCVTYKNWIGKFLWWMKLTSRWHDFHVVLHLNNCLKITIRVQFWLETDLVKILTYAFENLANKKKKLASLWPVLYISFLLGHGIETLDCNRIYFWIKKILNIHFNTINYFFDFLFIYFFSS